MHTTNWDLGVQPLRFASGLLSFCVLGALWEAKEDWRGFINRSISFVTFHPAWFYCEAWKDMRGHRHIHPSCSHFCLSWNTFGTKMDPEAGGQSCSCWAWESRWQFSITEPCAQHHVAWWLCEKQNTLLTLKEWQLLIVNFSFLNR